ncbi:hypothetical protein NPIL_633471 [Nephila pilipes]|uniref:Uncharacterized protein n=1 Tax=Nephila pilipes TaxID=299642 RepID=A0A8X6KKZ2_NEPPI|nr:hypothetical protein NPIL_633471 [Nephila pilipes]
MGTQRLGVQPGTLPLGIISGDLRDLPSSDRPVRIFSCNGSCPAGQPVRPVERLCCNKKLQACCLRGSGVVGVILIVVAIIILLSMGSTDHVPTENQGSSERDSTDTAKKST